MAWLVIDLVKNVESDAELHTLQHKIEGQADGQIRPRVPVSRVL